MSQMGGVDSLDELHPLKQEELVSATTPGCLTAAASLHQATGFGERGRLAPRPSGQGTSRQEI